MITKGVLVTDQRAVGIVLHERHEPDSWLERAAAQAGWRIAFVCTSAQQALEEIRRCAPALLLVDLDLPDGAGFDLLREAGRQWPACVAVAFSGAGRMPVELLRPAAPARHAGPAPAPPPAWPPAIAGAKDCQAVTIETARSAAAHRLRA